MSFKIKNKEKLIEELKKRPLTTLEIADIVEAIPSRTVSNRMVALMDRLGLHYPIYEDDHKFKILTDEDFEKYNKKKY